MAVVRMTAYAEIMSKTWEQYIHLAMFTAAVGVIVALVVW